MGNYLYLRSPEATTPTPVMLRIREHGKQVKISTQVMCLPKDWDSDNQQVKPSDLLYKHKNISLKSWLYEADKAVLQARDEGKELEDAKKAILKAKNREERPARDEVRDNNSLLIFYNLWATTRTQERTPTAQNLLSWNIIKSFRSPIAFEDVDAQFYEDFCRWMDDEKGYKTNMKGTQIKNLKAVMNAAYKQGLHTNEAFRRFKKPQEEADNVYLTQDELDAIYALPLTGYKAKARDIFLVGCYTAMRWSDFSRLEEKDITGDTIYFTHRKTGFRVSIPLHPIVQEILQRYGGKVPAISDQKLNTYIKDVCREAGITQPVTKVFHKGSERIEQVKPKCDMVTSHTARRTAATNMYMSGVPAYNIMLITGHTSEATFRKYIKFEKERNAELLRDHPYFKKREQ